MADFIKIEDVFEGSYGCMHRPPLHCKDDQDMSTRHLPPGIYDNKISKIMEIGEAKKEQREYSRMDDIDPNGLYHYTAPVRCKPDESTHTKHRITRCKKSGEDILKGYDGYQLLLIEDGGQNLSQFVDGISFHDTRLSTRDRMYRFWYQVRFILRGLQHMQASHTDDRDRLVHLDLKPGNIVYNETTHKLAMIDLGLTTSFDELATKFERNKFDLMTFHWNFAPELYFCNKPEFERIQSMSLNTYNDYIKGFEDAVRMNLKRTETEIDAISQRPHIYKIFNESLQFLIDFNRLDQKETSEEYLTSFKAMLDGIRSSDDKTGYDTFIGRVIPRIDVYSMGVSLMSVLSKTRNQVYDDALFSLFWDMMNPNVYERIDIATAIREYDTIWSNHAEFRRWTNTHDLSIVKDRRSQQLTTENTESVHSSLVKTPPTVVHIQEKAKSHAQTQVHSPPITQKRSPRVPDAPKSKRTRIGGTRRSRRTHRSRRTRRRTHRYRHRNIVI